MEFPITDTFSKFDQICSFLRIWSHLLKKSVLGNFMFCSVLVLFLIPFFLELKMYVSFLTSSINAPEKKNEQTVNRLACFRI